MLHLKQRLEYTINRIGFSKLTILYRKIIETTVFKHILFFCKFFVRLVHLKMKKDRKRRTVAAFAIATAAVIEKKV